MVTGPVVEVEEENLSDEEEEPEQDPRFIDNNVEVTGDSQVRRI